MADADLIYRPSTDDTPTYRLTPLSEFFVQFFDTYGNLVLEALNELDRTRDHIGQEGAASPLAGGLGERETTKLIHTKTWEEVRDDITVRLTTATDGPGPDPTQPGHRPARGFAFESISSADEIVEVLRKSREEIQE